MSLLRVELLESPSALLDHAPAWNDLWQRSEVTTPNTRAEGLHRWLAYFAADRDFQAVTVWDDARMVAALPLVAGRWAKVFRTGRLPSNEWLGAGTLLFDEHADPTGLHLIAETLNRLGWDMYRFAHFRGAVSAWQTFREALEQAGLIVEYRPMHSVTFIDIDSSWADYQATWSKNHRKKMTRAFKRLRELGSVEMLRVLPRTPAEVETAFLRAFQIEDAGWKGRAGTSVLRTVGMAKFLLESAQLLLPRSELEIAFLELNGEAIAYEILWNCRGVLHSYKVSYDERYAKCEPGGVLMHELLRELCETKRCHGYDCIGPTSYATEKWHGSMYPVSQLTAAPRKLLSRAALRAYQRWWKPAARPLEIVEATESVAPFEPERQLVSPKN